MEGMGDLFEMLKKAKTGAAAKPGSAPIPGLEAFGSANDVLGHAGKLMEFLDELSNDPEAYRK